MAFPLRPLLFLCERRRSIIGSAPKFLKSAENSPAVPDNTLSKISSSEFLETKYGLRLNFANGQVTDVLSIRPTLQPAESLPASPPASQVGNAPSTTQPPNPQYRYRLFPDWQTSYLWYDARFPHASAGQCHVDEDVIESRYPALERFYFTWQAAFESSFEQQECHLGSQSDVFPDGQERLAWELEGFLIACWLALQDDVEGVEYQPGLTAYQVEGASVREVLGRFLRDVDKRLGDEC